MGWTSWVAGRFLTGRRGGRGRMVFFFSVLLICIGVATLNTILAVMNGLQQGFINSILEIGSYHLRWIPGQDDGEIDGEIDRIADVLQSDPGVILAVPFREGQTMLGGQRSGFSGTLVRGVSPDVYITDASLASRLEIVEGRFELGDGAVVLGNELALNLGVGIGDSVRALSLSGDGLASKVISLEVSGLFECGYRVYGSSMAFVSLDTSERFLGDIPMEIGVKLIRPEADRDVLKRLDGHPSLAGGSLHSWRESNHAFFGALRNEKIMMILLLTLIFIVVAVNIDQSLRRMATERVEDISILKAMGATPGEIRILFLRHGWMIGGISGLLGSVLGVLIG
ncbi:MAG: hypothetical protein B6D68_01155, partial [spirochete symbiont of Stewartia floridana]